MTQLALSTHAVSRYQTRAEPHVSITEARLRLGRFVAFGRHRSTPRHWMREDVRSTPGLSFVYWAAMPDTCALVRDGVVVTVVTRALCQTTSQPAHLRSVKAPPPPDLRPVLSARWRWDGLLEEAA